MILIAPVLFLLALVAQLCHGGDPMRLKVVANYHVEHPDALTATISSMLIVDESRVKIKGVQYSSDQTFIDVVIVEGVPPNSVLRQELPVSSAKLEAAKFSSIEENIPEVPPQDNTIFFAASGSAAAGAVFTLIMIVYCGRSGKKDAREFENTEEMKKKEEKEKTEKRRIWERLDELDSKVTSLLAVEEQEQDEIDAIDRALKEFHKEKAPLRAAVAEDKVAAREAEVSAAAASSPPEHLALQVHYEDDDEKDERGLLDDERWWHRSGTQALKSDNDVDFKFLSAGARGVLERNADQGLAAIDPSHWACGRLPVMPSLIRSKVTIASSKIHGFGLFAKQYLDKDIVLFTWLAPSAVHKSDLYLTSAQLTLRYGVDWHRRLSFVTKHPSQNLYCVAEDPAVRGNGCLLNSVEGTELEANCEVVWADRGQGQPTPWIRTAATIPPFVELLLDYKFPAAEPQPKK